MQRELSYKVPFKRLREVGQLVRRTEFPTTIKLMWLLMALYVAALTGLALFSKTLDARFAAVGFRNGVVVSHGALFFLVPDSAFADADDRLAFIREVYSQLSDKARSISEKHVRAALSKQPSAA
jgi:hypothetical protein